MKSFRLTLGRRDKMMIMRLAQVAYLLKMRRLACWLYCKVPPSGLLIAATMQIEILMLSLMKASKLARKNAGHTSATL
jgi:hypothetical protein